MRPGPAHRGPAGHHCGRGRALAPWDPAPRPPDASGDPSSPLGLVGVLAPHMSPGSRLVLPAGPSQSPTSDHRRCPLRWRWRPLGRGDGDIPGELPRRFPHAVPECDRVLRLPTQFPLPRGHGGSARQDPSLPDPVSHASQMRGCPSGRSATLREGRPLLPDGNVAALSLVRGQGPEGIGSPPCVLPERSGRPCVLGHCTGCRPRSISAPGACGCHTGTAEPGVRTRRPRAASSADGFSRQGISSASKHILSKLYQRKDFPCH